MDFQKILDAATGNNWGDVRAKEFSAWQSGAGLDAPPGNAQLQNFINALKPKATTAARQRALKKLLGQVGTLGDRNHSKANTLIYQAALRAVEPECINQGNFGFCGPAAVLLGFAKASPDKYADCVVSLQAHDTGTLNVNQPGSLTLTPDSNWDTDYDSVKHKMGPADFVVLHSIRRAAEAGSVVGAGSSFSVTNPDDRRDRHATEPADMAALLTKAGYTDVQNNTFPNPVSRAPETRGDINTSITDCAALTRRSRGPVVILLTHPWLSVAACAEPRSGGSSWNDFEYDATGRKDPNALAELHWICVDRLTKTGLNIEMDFMSWGHHCSKSYTYDRFKHCYYGYISAEP